MIVKAIVPLFIIIINDLALGSTEFLLVGSSSTTWYLQMGVGLEYKRWSLYDWKYNSIAIVFFWTFSD
jgi:hypothetical protein